MAIGRLALRHCQRALHRLSTAPGATLRVVGNSSCSKLVVKTNMETYVAELEAAAEDGINCSDDEVAAWATNDGDDLSVAVAAHSATISVPASFNVSVAMDGDCDVDLSGWLEGTVDVEVSGRGAVGVNTVRGLLTRVVTGGGDVRVDHVEGNLAITGANDVKLGKIMGEEVDIDATGVVNGRALYAKRLDVAAAGGVHAAVLSAEGGVLSIGSDTTINSCEGELSIVVDNGKLTVQASEALRALSVEVKSEADPTATSVALFLPEGLPAVASVRAGELKLDERLCADGGGTAAAVGGGGEAAEMALGGAPKEGLKPGTLRIDAPSHEVSVSQQSWMERMQMKMQLSKATEDEGQANEPPPQSGAAGGYGYGPDASRRSRRGM